jgi:hypothetical protein
MFHSSFSTARRFCLALIVLAATALSVPSGQPAATFSYPASAVGNTGAAADVTPLN